MVFFRDLARDPNPAVRAGALLRLGRNLRKAGQTSPALEVYRELAQLGSVPVGQLPAALLALEARCSVLSDRGTQPELRREAQVLYDALQRGAWPLLRAAYEFHLEEARRWTGEPQIEQESYSRAIAGAAEWLWDRARTDQPPSQRLLLSIHGRPVLLAWRRNADGFVALLAGAQYLEAGWRDMPSIRAALTDTEGHVILGTQATAGTLQVIRTPDTTGLPWTLRISAVAADQDAAETAARRRLLIFGFALMILFFSAGTYFVLRAIGRELAVARLQADFVAAVSHEFRTPLTAVRQFSEILLKGRVTTEESRHECYELLHREGERLHTLVEDLLDFGRIERGRYRYHFEPLDLAGFLRAIVAEFQGRVAAQGYWIELAAPDSLAVTADREALRRAIWNLLDNAVKYSPESRTVWVDLEPQHNVLAIRVRDRGIGIPAREQKEIFKKFVRGSNSQPLQIKGTGIGLAMVHHIVEAHRGRIRVESAPERGSTFTVFLPTEKTA